MINVSTNFLGIELKNPIIISSGAITGNINKLIEAEKNEASAVILKTLSEEKILRKPASPKYGIFEKRSNIPYHFTFYSLEESFRSGKKEYISFIKEVKKALKIPVIGSINANAKNSWIDFSKSVENAGADALEINITDAYLPMLINGENIETYIYETAKTVKEAVNIPVIVKLSGQITAPVQIILKLKDLGINAVTIFDSFQGLEIDTENEKPAVYKTFSSHEGSWSINYSLKWISEIYEKVKGIDISAAGGIGIGTDAIKFLLSGASTIQLNSSIYLQGFSIIKKILREIIEYSINKNYKRLSDFRGNISGKINDIKDIDRSKKVYAVINRKGIPPCQDSCPAKINVQGYINLILNGKYEEGLALIREKTPLASICGRICHAPCEKNCIRGKLDTPVAIEKLKRFLTEREDYELLDEYPYLGILPDRAEEINDKKIAVIGAGPAGLTCAYHLHNKGYNVEVFESENESGGMLKFAIPNFRLPDISFEQDMQYLKRCGVKIQNGIKLGKDISIKQLQKDGYDVIFLALGNQKSFKPGIKGENLNGVYDSIEFLKKINTKKRIKIGKNVVIIGGGNSAIFSARAALRMGAVQVTLLYRRTKKDLQVENTEFINAVKEGINFKFLVSPVEITGKKEVSKIVYLKNRLSPENEEGIRQPIPNEKLLFDIEADTVIIGLGQGPDLTGIDLPENIEYTKEGFIKVDPDTLETGAKGIFAGGDIIEGKKSSIHAIASGIKAAGAIDAYLKEEIFSESIRYQTSEHIITPEEVLTGEEDIHPRHPTQYLYIKESIANFKEIEMGYDEDSAKAEAERCLMCGICSACNDCFRVCPYNAIERNGYHTVITDDCVGCGLCAIVCHPKAIELKPYIQKK